MSSQINVNAVPRTLGNQRGRRPTMSYNGRLYQQKMGIPRLYRRNFGRRYLSTYKAPQAYKLRTNVSLNSNAGGVISFSTANNPSGISEWASLVQLFDSYKVTGMKIKYMPHLPNDTSVTTGYTPIYIVMDPDSPLASLSNISQAIEYDNLKTKNLYKPWSVYYKMPKVSQVPLAGSIVLANGWLDIDNVSSTSAILGYSDGLDISTTYGTLLTTYYVKVKNRK